MAHFKFELGATAYIAANAHEVTIAGRTEFAGGKQNRYYVTSPEAIPGKNHGEDWINESALVAEKPVLEAPPQKLKNQRKPAPERVEAVTPKRQRR